MVIVVTLLLKEEIVKTRRNYMKNSLTQKSRQHKEWLIWKFLIKERKEGYDHLW